MNRILTKEIILLYSNLDCYFYFNIFYVQFSLIGFLVDLKNDLEKAQKDHLKSTTNKKKKI